MSIPAFSVRQPVLVNLLAIVVVVSGILLYRGMTREAMPQVGMDAAVVVALYPGVSASEMESLFARPIEDAIASVDGVKTMYVDAAESIVFFWIEMEPDVDDAQRVVLDIQSEVARIRELPADADPPTVRLARNEMPALTVAVTGRDATQHELRDVSRRLKEQLERVSGVREVHDAGLPERQIRVDVDPRRLEAVGLSLPELAVALGARDRDVPGGVIRVGAREMSLRSLSAYGSLDDLRDTVVRPSPMGDHLRVRDVATVRDVFADPETGARVNGAPGVILTVRKNGDADVTKLAVAVRQNVESFSKTLPPGFAVEIFGDSSRIVNRGIDSVQNNGLFGLLIVLGTLWLFLGARNAIMTAIGIPVAILGGIVMMHLLGLTINQLSLFALIVCLGLIVDDAIVVIENAYRYIEEGHTRIKAAYLGVREVFWPVIATVATTIAAFLPLLLMTGTLGKFLAVIPKVVVAALVASLFECLIVLPSHVADFAASRQRKVPGRYLMRALRWVYAKTFPAVLRYRYISVTLVFVLAVSMVVAALMFKEIVLMADEDAEMIDVRVEMPEDTHLDETERVLREMEALAEALPAEEVDVIQTQWGWARTHLWGRRGRHRGMVTVILVEPDQRSRGSEEIMAELRAKVTEVPGPVRVEVAPLEFKPPTGQPVAIRIIGENLERIDAVSAEAERILKDVEGTRDVARDYSEGKEELLVRLEPAKAALFGLGPRDVDAWVRTAYGGLPVSHYRTDDGEYDVVLRFQEDARDMATEVGELRIRSPLGVVRLADVATLTEDRGPGIIQRRDRKRIVTVTANIDERTTTAAEVNRAAQAALSELIAANQDLAFEFGGEFEETDKSVQSLLVAFQVAILVILTILGAQFRSFIQPLVVVFAIPLSFIGVITGFFVSGRPIDLVGLIGVVGLAGIAVNDSLILVDFINTRRRHGMDRDQAIRESGLARLRPIILTSVTTVGGLLPLAAGWGGKAEMLEPMAVAIVWGLSFATLFTLYVIPCLYAIADDAVGLFVRKRQVYLDEWDDVAVLDRMTERELIRWKEEQARLAAAPVDEGADPAAGASGGREEETT